MNKSTLIGAIIAAVVTIVIALVPGLIGYGRLGALADQALSGIDRNARDIETLDDIARNQADRNVILEGIVGDLNADRRNINKALTDLKFEIRELRRDRRSPGGGSGGSFDVYRGPSSEDNR